MRAGFSKINPFAGLKDWVGVLNHVAMSLYVPSYMSWNDEFACEKMDSSEGAQECVAAHSKKVGPRVRIAGGGCGCGGGGR